ncbi:MAG: hypothetical protein H0U02_13305 [Rubrobacter sp.]|nr:hypothetical protein [Rubrobacter sp.]
MRLGELGGLFWSDVDLDRRVIHVQRALVTGRGGQTFEPPKTRGSRRSVGLARIAVDALTEHRERAEREGRAVKPCALHKIPPADRQIANICDLAAWNYGYRKVVYLRSY